jgi:acetolactate synthase-1/2/3 large subunit
LSEVPIAGRTDLAIPKLGFAAPPAGDSGSAAELARMLVEAQNPVVVAGRMARTHAGMSHLVEFAELLQVPVVDSGARLNFPSRHPLNVSGNARRLVESADLILGLEIADFLRLGQHHQRSTGICISASHEGEVSVYLVWQRVTTRNFSATNL